MIRYRKLCCCGLVLAVLACCLAIAFVPAPRQAAAIDTAGGKPIDVPFWPQWRGPNRDDISPDTGLLQQWPKEGPPLAWKHTGMGAGFSSVTIEDGRIFTMGDLDGAQWLIALKLDGGDELWKARVGEPVGARPTTAAPDVPLPSTANWSTPSAATATWSAARSTTATRSGAKAFPRFQRQDALDLGL